MNNEDKRLLELAAKAANQERSVAGDLWSNARGTLWNPLEDDGDALRLAVEISKRKNGIAILLNSRFDSKAFASVYTDADHLCGQEYMVDDPNAATRRAIVRAAAEIGKAMP